MASNGNWSEAGTQRLIELAVAGWTGKESQATAGPGGTPEESLSTRLARTCKQPVDGLNRQPKAFLHLWINSLKKLLYDKYPPDRDLQSLYKIHPHYRGGHNTPDDFFRESHYTLKCLLDAGEMIMKLENTGTTGEDRGKVFDNKRIVFKSR